MSLSQDIENAKKAYDHAWAEAAKAGAEALDALRMLERVPARDTNDVFQQKLRRALSAYENWRNAAELASKVLSENYFRLWDYLGEEAPVVK